MKDQDVEARLKRLEDIETRNRERSLAYLKKHRSEGKKQISGMISAEAYDIICRRRDESIQAGAPLTTGDIINEALLNIAVNIDKDIIAEKPAADKGRDSKQMNIFDPDEIVPDDDPDLPEQSGAPASPLGDYHGQDIPLGEKDKIIIKLAADLPGRKNAKARVDALNTAGITCGPKHEQWTVKKFADNLRFARKRQGKA